MNDETSEPHYVPLSELQRIQSAAIDNAREGITITDARRPDNPLIFVNRGFEVMSGYSAAEVLGKNCRFLQGTEKEQAGVRDIAGAVVAGQGILREIINFRKEGTPFWNRLSITPVLDADGTVSHFIGIQEDITAQKEKAALEATIARQALIADISLSASERQREETGRELHDNVNQILALAMLHLNTAIRDEASRLPMLQRSKEVLHEAIREIRELSRRLVGPDLNETLLAALTRLLDNLQESAPFRIGLDFGDDVDASLTPRRKLTLYRVVQEQMQNIMKHAQPEQVTLELARNAAGIRLLIRDDGVGFDPKKHSGGIGLQNMRGRVELEGGRLDIRSAPGLGCEIAVQLPAAGDAS